MKSILKNFKGMVKSLEGKIISKENEITRLVEKFDLCSSSQQQ